MPIERRIREGAERNADVLDPDVDRFLDSVIHRTRRRLVVRGRSLLPPRWSWWPSSSSLAQGCSTTSKAWMVARCREAIRRRRDARCPVADGHVHEVDPRRHRGRAGERHRGDVDNVPPPMERFGSRLPRGSQAHGLPSRSSCRRPRSGPTRSAPTSAPGCRPGRTAGRCRTVLRRSLQAVGSVRRTDRDPHRETLEDQLVTAAGSRGVPICFTVSTPRRPWGCGWWKETLRRPRRYAHASSSSLGPRRGLVGGRCHPRHPVRIGLSAHRSPRFRDDRGGPFDR